jgi:hypothetical protein
LPLAKVPGVLPTIAAMTVHQALAELEAIGGKIGAYRDYRCSKGFTPPSEPIAIREPAKRNG